MLFNVAVVLVTYNRVEKLKKALVSYNNQLLKPKHIIVVNNNSNDGTSVYLESWKLLNDSFEKHVINLNENIGGSGGFFIGEKYAMELDGVDWIMIADDDAYPEIDYLSGLKHFLDFNSDNKIGVVCGKVVQPDGFVNIHRTYFTSSWNWNFHRYATEKDYKQKYFYPDYVSYVGIVIRKKILEKAGLVDKNFFIWNDDTEHSQRMRKYCKFVCVPSLSIVHDVSQENNSLSWKRYYSYRNKTVFFKRHYKLQMPFVVGLVAFKSLLCPLKGKSIAEAKLRINAIFDGLLGRLGKHPIYKPGWKP